MLLGRLAVDSRYRGKGLGAGLLIDALHRAFGNPIAAAFVVVDALDDRAEAFYRKYGFISLPDSARRLFLPMKTIERLFRPSDFLGLSVMTAPCLGFRLFILWLLRLDARPESIPRFEVEGRHVLGEREIVRQTVGSGVLAGFFQDQRFHRFESAG